ncbi:hypothetical protein COHA_005832 [Chlorella ohadii]|uniref:Dienelactone hydrolase domain-containing protein n=1 Tax=Chlorella ohadii TaxID=2649997 RepID=A0AAD5DNX5_9CHLO|nr:hypothetical protein COHA_005832 [Chlorella ohadii]
MAQPQALTALRAAIARSRTAPSSPQVRPAPARPAAPSSAFAGLHVEELQLCSEADNAASLQAWVPLRIVGPPAAAPSNGTQQQQQRQRPAVILLHATGVDMSSLAEQQAAFARRGFVAVAIDCRYHGARSEVGAGARDGYQLALVRAWRGSGERPFLLDNVWDLQRVLDYLQQRPDVDAARIGVTGISLGGMHSWLLAVADDRIAAAAPMIGVQHFGWAVQQGKYHARVESIPLVFQAAAADMQADRQQQQQSADGGDSLPLSNGSGSYEVTPEVVAAVWDRLLPGLLEHYDAPQSLPLLAPRPLLVANGELDPRCPMQARVKLGVELAMAAARAAYEQQGAADKLQLYVVPGCNHECTACMWEQVHAFFDRHLLNAA